MFSKYIENLILFFASFFKKSCKLKVVKKTLPLIDCLEKKILLFLENNNSINKLINYVNFINQNHENIITNEIFKIYNEPNNLLYVGGKSDLIKSTTNHNTIKQFINKTFIY